MPHAGAYAATRIVVFPLVNQSGDKITQWISYAPPESFYRALGSMLEIRMWDPAFLFVVDSSGWTMASDSLLRIHWTRWEWDAALGGSYSVVDGGIIAQLKLYLVKGGRITIKKIIARAPVSNVPTLCADVLAQTLEGLNLRLSASDQARLLRPIVNSEAYPTYVAAYGYEMRGENSAAITAYSRVCELDPSCAAAFCRIGALYAAGNTVDSARISYDKCLSTGSIDPALVAKAADFYVDHALPEKSSSFIRANQQVLEQTAIGMKAIGKSLLVSGGLQRAIAAVNRALAMGEADLDIDFILGKAYLATEDFAQASEIFNRLVKYRPDCMMYYALLGSAYRLSGRLMESAKVLENAARISPDNLQICLTLAQTYVDIGWFKNAYQALLRAKEKAPESPEIFVDLGVVLWHLGKHDEAATLLKQAEKLGLNKQSALVNEANLLVLSGENRKAISGYRRADKAGKKSEIILMNLGNAYMSIGKLREASQCFEEVLSMTPQRLDVLTLQADIAEKRKKDKDAEIYLRKIIDLSPHNLEAVERLTVIFERQKRFKEALDPIETYLNDFPNSKTALLLQAHCYHAMEWYEVAMMKYQAIIRDFPDSWEGYLGLGKTMYDAIVFKNFRDYDKAIYYLKIAGDKAANNPEPDYLIGAIYLNYKNYRELALDYLKKALSKTTDDSF
ncbi:MAG TPA: tetratricopeptide repeat protein, partial [Chitinivibrionales bacterium]